MIDNKVPVHLSLIRWTHHVVFGSRPVQSFWFEVVLARNLTVYCVFNLLSGFTA